MSVQDFPMFKEFERFSQSDVCWLHKDKPVWIVQYDAVPGIRLETFIAYRVAAPLPKGRDPWTVDNRRIGEYGSLVDAMRANA